MEYIYQGIEDISRGDVSLSRSIDHNVHPTIWTRTSLEIHVGMVAS